MSISDETWDRPTCPHCKQTIAYGKKLEHRRGLCMNNTTEPPLEITKTVESAGTRKFTTRQILAAAQNTDGVQVQTFPPCPDTSCQVSESDAEPGKLINIHDDPCAVRWATEFIKTKYPYCNMEGIEIPLSPFASKQQIDIADEHSLMISWFANAMMAAHDFLERRHQDADREVYVLINSQTSELVAVYSKLPCKSICDRDYSLHLGKDLQCIGGSDIPVAGQGSNWNCVLYKAKVDSLNRIRQRIKIEYQNGD